MFLDVSEAQSGLALRQAKLNEARQKKIEAANQVAAFFAGPNSCSISVHATDIPNPGDKEQSYDQMGATALQLNPDYLIQVQKDGSGRSAVGLCAKSTPSGIEPQGKLRPQWFGWQFRNLGTPWPMTILLPGMSAWSSAYPWEGTLRREIFFMPLNCK